MTVTIEHILRRAEQGVTRPFLCKGDDDSWYWVKGRGAGLRSLICEWVVGRMALAFGLPVAPFARVDVPSELLLTALRPDFGELGAGPAFGSLCCEAAQELTLSHLRNVAPQQQCDVLVFDWWVHNQDRTLTRHGGNPNLLWDQSGSRLVVIDHNQAFDPQFDETQFLEQHVFSGASESVCDDLADRALYMSRFDACMEVFDTACDEVPESWWWMDEGVPTDFDRHEARDLLLRYSRPDFWSAK